MFQVVQPSWNWLSYANNRRWTVELRASGLTLDYLLKRMATVGSSNSSRRVLRASREKKFPFSSVPTKTWNVTLRRPRIIWMLYLFVPSQRIGGTRRILWLQQTNEMPRLEQLSSNQNGKGFTTALCQKKSSQKAERPKRTPPEEKPKTTTTKDGKDDLQGGNAMSSQRWTRPRLRR